MENKYINYFLACITFSCFIFCLGVIIEVSTSMENIDQFKNNVDVLKINFDYIETSLNRTRDELNRTKSNLIKVNQSLELHHQTSVPIGFIYIQLPNQTEPGMLWPHMRWTEMSTEYAGLFFRVLGGNSLHFTDIQEEVFPKVVVTMESDHGFENFDSVTVDRSGTRWGWSGDRSSRVTRNIKFNVSSHEVRPRNTAIKIWKRYK